MFISREAEQLARTLWDYQRLNEEPTTTEVIIAMGCEDGRVAERAAQLYLGGYGKWLICTGRSGSRTKEMLAGLGFVSEASYFAAIAKEAGVPPSRILIEGQSTNSGENIANIRSLLAVKNIPAGPIIIVAPPYSERRQQATYAAQWPGQAVIITSPQLTFETYPTKELTMEYLINALVGRVQRMKVYGDTGFQTKTEISEDVWSACVRLIELGFTKQLA